MHLFNCGAEGGNKRERRKIILTGAEGCLAGAGYILPIVFQSHKSHNTIQLNENWKIVYRKTHRNKNKHALRKYVHNLKNGSTQLATELRENNTHFVQITVPKVRLTIP